MINDGADLGVYSMPTRLRLLAYLAKCNNKYKVCYYFSALIFAVSKLRGFPVVKPVVKK